MKIPAQRAGAHDRPAHTPTVNLGTTAGAWPTYTTVSMTITQDGPTHRATVHVAAEPALAPQTDRSAPCTPRS